MAKTDDSKVLETAIRAMDARRVMAIATVRPDGGPQNTIVGYANEGLTVYFLIFRDSQKFCNIALDARVAIAIGEQPLNIQFAEAVYAGGHAAEVTDLEEKLKAWELLATRHPNLAGRRMPDAVSTAFMRASCEHLSVLDYSQGLGHTASLDYSKD